MGDTIGKLFGMKKPEGPSDGEKLAQKEARDAAAKERADAERLAALAGRASSRKRALTFNEGKATLG